MKLYRCKPMPWVAVVGVPLAPAVWAPVSQAKEQSNVPAGIRPTEMVLPNGLTLLLIERHEQPTIATGWRARQPAGAPVLLPAG